jgi:hypothetical protein
MRKTPAQANPGAGAAGFGLPAAGVERRGVVPVLVRLGDWLAMGAKRKWASVRDRLTLLPCRNP